MKCEDCEIKLEKYLEGDLDAQSAVEALAHVSNCKECERTYEYLKLGQKALAPYLVKVKASSDLWTGLEAKIKAENQIPVVSSVEGSYTRIRGLFERLNYNRALAASFALLLIGGSFGLLIHFFFKESSYPRQDLANSSGVSNSKKTNEGSRAEGFPNSSVTFKKAETNLSYEASVESKSIARKSQNLDLKSSSLQGEQITKNSIRETKFGKHFVKAAASSIDGANEHNNASLSKTGERFRKQAASLERDTARQVEKARILLRSFRNAAYAEGEPLFDIESDRKQARQLLQNNVLLRQRAQALDNFEIEEMLGTLEPYLLDIANLNADATTDEMRMIKDRILKEEIVASLQVY